MIFKIDFTTLGRLRNEAVFHNGKENIITKFEDMIGATLQNKIKNNNTVVIDIYSIEENLNEDSSDIFEIINRPENAHHIKRLYFQANESIIKTLEAFIETNSIYQLS